MKRVLYLVRQPPGIAADETTDMILVSGVFEQPTTVLFMDDGIYQLVGLDDRKSSLKALPTYEVSDLYAARSSLASRGVAPEDIDGPLSVEVLNDAAVRDLVNHHDVVVPD